tara:strand:- start:31884 stop:32144 length:261 start_codon:yes stop_codon:yes gene_type:complete
MKIKTRLKKVGNNYIPQYKDFLFYKNIKVLYSDGTKENLKFNSINRAKFILEELNLKRKPENKVIRPKTITLILQRLEAIAKFTYI